jgi:hypothetical protein
MTGIYKTLSGLGVALAALLVTNTVALGQQTAYLGVGPAYGGTNPYQDNDGGEFTALLDTNGVPNPVPAGYSSLATLAVNGVTGFETFCLEDAVDFWVGTTYDYEVTPDIQVPIGAQNGAGYSGYTDEALSQGTAWLYEQFATGDLAGYNYTNATARLADAGVLQETIWFLQGEAPPPTNTVYLADMETEFSTLPDALQAETPNEFGVNVIDLYSTGANGAINGVYQDQLIFTGVPDGATTIGLLGIALLVLAFLKRRSPTPA